MGAIQSAMVSVVKQFMTISGHLTSGPRDPKPPQGIKQLNNHVWQLACPEEYDVEIIFFHGLQMGDFEDAFWKTWRARDDENVVWPRDWLCKRLPKARILSVSYNSSATKRRGQADIQGLGDNLCSDIIGDSTSNIGQKDNCPVFLVGHSLGGIVIKQFISRSVNQVSLYNSDTHDYQIQRFNKFLRNWKGVFYYATPHRGSRIADLAAELPQTSPILRLLKVLDTEKQIINEEFAKHLANMRVRSFAVAEGLPTVKSICGIVVFEEMVVEEASALADFDEKYKDTYANHMTVCKATRKDPAVIDKLTQFITGAAPAIHHVPEADVYSTDPSRPVEL